MSDIGPEREQGISATDWVTGTILLKSAEAEMGIAKMVRDEVGRLEMLFLNNRPLAEAEILGELDDLVDLMPSCDGGAEGCDCADIDELWDAS